MRVFFASLAHNARVFHADWRGKVVLYPAIAACVVTLLTYCLFPSVRNVGHFPGAVFASWVAGLLLFAITGFIVVLVSLARPENDLLGERVANLLQKQQGEHIKYISEKIVGLFEPYLESVERTMHVVRHDPATQMFLVNQDTKLVYRSYLSDVECKYDSRVGYHEASPPPTGEGKPCLVYLRVDGKDVGVTEEFDKQITREFPIRIAPYSTSTVEHRMTFWVKENEANTQLVIRFAKKLTVAVHNQLGKDAIRVVVEKPANTTLDVPVSQKAAVVNLIDIHPQKDDKDYSFDFRFSIAR